MEDNMRVMSERPLNAETRAKFLRSWITANAVFFDRNQSEIMKAPIPLEKWNLSVTGEVEHEVCLTFDDILRMPKAIVANTMECSGNGRSLLVEKARGNPWTIGGVGNAVWGGVWLKDILNRAVLKSNAGHVGFEGFDQPLGKAEIKFVRSIPVEKAMASTLLAYEMNGEPLPVKHGYPLRGLALGWTGANCVKWLQKITVRERPFEGFFMDNVYRVFQKGETPESGEVVTGLKLKAIITQPLHGEKLSADTVVVLGAAFGGEKDVASVKISLDNGDSWHETEFIGPHEPYAWRQWQYVWQVAKKGNYTILARAVDSQGNRQPMEADWNVLGYGNNGVREHGVKVQIV